MTYGFSTGEQIKFLCTRYKIAAENYIKMIELMRLSKNDENVLKSAIEACTLCHNALYEAIEQALLLLAMGSTLTTNNDERNQSLIQLSRRLHKIVSSGERCPLPHANYASVASVDLNTFIIKKEFRNDFTHNSLMREARHYNRLFINLQRLITIINVDFDEPIPSEDINPGTDTFGNLLSFTNHFKQPHTCSLVLILDSVWDISDENLVVLLSQPWDLIIDFDGRGVGKDGKGQSRIEHIIKENADTVIPLFALNPDLSVLSVHLTDEKIPYFNYSDGDISLNIKTEKSKAASEECLKKPMPGTSKVILTMQPGILTQKKES